ncbi:cytochrome P450 71A6-like [Olea europaea subsp. europaea]|uniref:Cytochrome P450 71A6-like n=1 Tax=Olea europaea subsp. europaea TaxID=158383 RepID=A0A8S0R6G1_OLEEU|nr:cytochrome P450 71A6-like [Olea europaea subsp. europaea]
MSSFLQLLLPFASFFLFTILVFKWYFNPASTAGKRIPSPPKLPVIGNLHQLGLFPHRALQALSKRYGPIMMLHLGSVPAVIVSSAEGAREIMKTHDLVFSNRPKVSIPDKIVYGSKDIAFAPYGEHWRQVRSICVLHLLSFKRVQSFRYIREEETDLMIQKIRQSSTSPTSVTNLSNLLVSVTNDTICRVALGRKYSDGEADGSNKFELMLKEIMEIAGTFNVGDYIPWLKWMNMVNGLDARVDRLAKTFDKFLSSIVEEHRSRRKQENSSNATDLVDLLLEIQSEKKTSFTLDDETMKSVIFDMFAAGTDTTYTSLEWTVTEEWENPEEFNPERFFNNTEVDFRGFNFEYIPFGAGRRGCPGITFAMAVNEFALAKLMLNFDFALPIGAKDWDLLEAVGSTVHKKHPLLVVATPCSS